MINKKRTSKVFLCLLMIICSVIVFSACEIVNRPSISSISVVYTPGEEDVYPDTSLDELKDFVVVKVHYSDDTTETITDYVLSGTLEEGESVITVSYKGFEKTFTVNVSEKPNDDSHVHNLVKHEAKTATCTEDGNIEYWSCSVCHKNYSDENATVEVSEIVTTTDEHRFSDKWSTDIYHHWHAAICGHNVKSDYAEHTFADGKCMVCQIDEVSQTQGLAYTLNNDKKSYTVTGIGTATDVDLIIPSSYNGFPVTGIDSWAFFNCDSLTSVAIPESVTSIGQQAFYGCRSLTSVTIGNGVTLIGDYAFGYCSSLTSVTIPDSVTSIGQQAFVACRSLTSVTIPDGVTSIGDDAFSSCRSLTSVTIGSGVISIDEDAFDSCFKLVEVYNLSSLPITKGSEDYGKVGYYALNVYTSKDEASKLAKTEDGYIFYEDGDAVYLIGYTGGEKELTLPDKFNDKNYEIYKYAFNYCRSITSVTIPDSVTSIGQQAFYGCRSLTSVTIPSSVTSIGDYAFYGCSALTNVKIGNGVTSIGNYAFYGCSALTNVKIGSGVTSIGEFAFHGCSSLTSVYYNGTAEEWSNIAIGSNNTYLLNATRYYYSETEPATNGNFWHYVDGEIVVW
ncbi:MAG: leucine-rich repeat domain-containing protein [Christensenellaceae bacterium]|nr:leucine-rich repeat domain-containing protein [Christensenellaceae bacterium]